jgi:DnaJ-class molecular chaperone
MSNHVQKASIVENPEKCPICKGSCISPYMNFQGMPEPCMDCHGSGLKSEYDRLELEKLEADDERDFKYGIR